MGTPIYKEAISQKASQSFVPRTARNQFKSVFCRDTCVAENTLRGARVAAALRVARHEAQRILLEKAACRFFDNSKGRLLPPFIVAQCTAAKQEIYSALLRLSTMSIFFILKCASTLTRTEKSIVRIAAYT